MKRRITNKLLLKAVLLTSLGVMTAGLARASTNVFNFDSDPSSLFSQVVRGGDNATLQSMAGFWTPTNGSTLEAVADQSTNGYFAITQTTPNGVSGAHGMRAAIIFNDFDNGLIVAGFTFACDLRIGAGNSSPADGFSLNYARAGDPCIANGNSFSGGPNNNPANAPEEGTTTGLALSFDCYDNGGGDVIGLTIKVDNTVITNLAMPTKNGLCTDITSLQTGTNDTGLAGLCWQPLWVYLDPTNQLLTVSYKNQVLLTNYPVSFAPSPGRLIFAGRTGGSWQEQDVDNIRIVTVPSPWPVIGPVSSKANGWKFSISDSGFATPDTSTITVAFDGTPVTPTAITQIGNIGGGDGTGFTTVTYENPSLLMAPGSRHTNHVHFTGSTFSGPVDKDVTFVVPAYAMLSAAQQAPGAVNTNITDGFFGRINQLPIARYPDPLSISGIEKQLANGFIDPGTGLPYVSVDPVSAFTNNWINWNAEAPINNWAGYFNYTAAPDFIADDPVPGVDFITDSSITNIAAEILSVLYLPVGAYQLGLSHDDGVKITVGPEPRDVFAATVLASQTTTADIGPANIVVTNAGYYPFRVLWGQAGGAGNIEFYVYDWATGQKMLLNDRSKPTTITAYADRGAFTLPYVSWVGPAAGETGVLPDAHIIAKLEDGSGGTITSSRLTVNGVLATGTKLGSTTTIDLNPSRLANGVRTATLIYGTSLGTSVTNTWTFTVIPIALDKTHNYVGIGQGVATQSSDAGGHTGTAGDYSIDLGNAGGASMLITDAGFLTALNAAHASDVVTYSIWEKLRLNLSNNSLIWADTPPAGTRAVNLHCPYGNTVYFDTGGFDNTLNRISKDITTFSNYINAAQGTGWWTNWHHVVIIKNGSTGTDKWVYIDGSLLLAGANTAPLLSNVISLNLGSANANGNAVHGWIDDFAVYSTALSEADITALASGTAPDAIAGKASLIAYWPFNEAPGARPSIRLTQAGSVVTITFVGTLQSCSTVNGTYADVIGASSPYTASATGLQMFYRTH